MPGSKGAAWLLDVWFETETAALEAGVKVRERKERRGYQAVSG